MRLRNLVVLSAVALGVPVFGQMTGQGNQPRQGNQALQNQTPSASQRPTDRPMPVQGDPRLQSRSARNRWNLAVDTSADWAAAEAGLAMLPTEPETPSASSGGTATSARPAARARPGSAVKPAETTGGGAEPAATTMPVGSTGATPKAGLEAPMPPAPPGWGVGGGTPSGYGQAESGTAPASGPLNVSDATQELSQETQMQMKAAPAASKMPPAPAPTPTR